MSWNADDHDAGDEPRPARPEHEPGRDQLGEVVERRRPARSSPRGRKWSQRLSGFGIGWVSKW